MPRLAVFLLLGLAGCAAFAAFDTGQQAGPGSGDMPGWRFASGKPPSRAEYAAVVAACQDGALKRAQGKPFESCLADLGLKRAE